MCRVDGLYSADVGSSRYLDDGFCGVSGDFGKDVVFFITGQFIGG